jgi:hypothetical protein
MCQISPWAHYTDIHRYFRRWQASSTDSAQTIRRRDRFAWLFEAGGRAPSIFIHYDFLIPRRSIRNRKLTRLSGKERADKESIMLDVAFVALGIAVLALMGVYALALRQL